MPHPVCDDFTSNFEKIAEAVKQGPLTKKTTLECHDLIDNFLREANSPDVTNHDPFLSALSDVTSIMSVAFSYRFALEDPFFTKPEIKLMQRLEVANILSQYSHQGSVLDQMLRGQTNNIRYNYLSAVFDPPHNEAKDSISARMNAQMIRANIPKSLRTLIFDT